MIIDLILDRQDGETYNAKSFYNSCIEYSTIFNGLADDITRAMDCGTEEDVKKALCDYIIRQEYNLKIIEFINSKNWLINEPKLFIGERCTETEPDIEDDFEI